MIQRSWERLLTIKGAGLMTTLNKTFTARLEKSPAKGGWTYVTMPGSAKFFGTKGLVRVQGTVDGHPFQSSFMALGDGRHKLPVKADILRATGKKQGDTVRVLLKERINLVAWLMGK